MALTTPVVCTKEANELMRDGILAFSEASQQGMRVDTDYCKKQSKILEFKTKKLKKQFMDSKTGRLWANVYRTPNLNSGPQLANILYEKKKLSVLKKTEKGNPSVDNETLEGFVDKIPELSHLIEYRKLHKINKTYLGNFIRETVNGVMRPGYSLHIPRTYRSSSQSPNFQNIPTRDEESKQICRKAIIPRPGFQLLEADFGRIEVNVGACVHRDPKMLEYARNPENEMHGDMAQQIFKLDSFIKEGGEATLRKGSKNGFVFPQFYGDYYGNNAVSLCVWGELPVNSSFSKNDGVLLSDGTRLGAHLIKKGIKSFDDFIDHVKWVENDFWKRRFKVYSQWKDNNVKEYHKKGYLEMITGFVCSGVMTRNEINNYPIQGPAFHCNLKTFIKLNQEIKKRGLKSRLIGQIHDSMVMDVHPSEMKEVLELIRWVACEWLLEQWKWIIVPMEIEANIFGVDENWASTSETIELHAA